MLLAKNLNHVTLTIYFIQLQSNTFSLLRRTDLFTIVELVNVITKVFYNRYLIPQVYY